MRKQAQRARVMTIAIDLLRCHALGTRLLFRTTDMLIGET